MVKEYLTNIKNRFRNQFTLSSLKKQILEVKKDISGRDISFLLIFPIVITLIMLIQTTVQELLKLDIKNPYWWQFFTHSFVQNDWSHLINNLVGYFIYALLIFLLAIKCGEKRTYHRLFLFTILTLPFLGSWVQVKFYPLLFSWLPNLKYSAGSSDILSALAGFMPIFWMIYLKKKNDNFSFNIYLFQVFILYIALLFVVTYTQKIFSYISFFIFIIIFGLIYLYKKNFKFLVVAISREIEDNVFSGFFVIIVPLFFFVTPFLVFPSPLLMLRNERFTDFFMHYIGLSYGLVISSSYFLFIKKLGLGKKFRDWQEKREEKIQDKKVEEMARFYKKIVTKMPELQDLSLQEAIRTYRQIRAIKSQIFNNWAMFVLTLFIILLTWRQLSIIDKQNLILANQTGILERSSPPYEPWIQIIPDSEDQIIYAEELTDTRNIENNWAVNKRWAQISFTIYNFGKTDSQHIHCFEQFSNDSLGGYITPNNNFQNIPSGTSNRSILHIRYSDCYAENIKDCRPELVPTGKQKVTLICECYGCKTQRYFNSTIDFCIYYQNSTICK